MSQKGIGRQVQFGIVKESVRGTSPATPSYYLAWSELDLQEKYENVKDVEVYGVIEDNANQTRVKNWAEGTVKMPLVDNSLGLLLYSLLGGYSVAAHSGETTVYDHSFTVAQSVQHQSLSAYVHDPLSGQDYSHANAVVTKMDIEFALKKFLEISFTLKGQKGVQISSLTPVQTAENRFVPQYVTFKVASSYAGLSGGTTIGVKSLKLTADQNTDDDDVLGSTSPRDFLNKEFKVEGTIEAIFQSEADFKTASLANTYKAISIDVKNTDVNIGTVPSHPELNVSLAKAFFTEISVKRTPKELVYQTVKFTGAYSLTDALMIKAILTNTNATY